MSGFFVNTTMLVSLVQPNFRQGGNTFAGYWIPYSVGCVYSYSAQSDRFKNKLKLGEVIFARDKINETANNLAKSDIVLFSCYMWNWEYNKTLAEKLKQTNPKTKIIFGGPQVSEFKTEEQVEQLGYVDTLIISEGELSFYDYLLDYENNETKTIYSAKRVDDLNIPSPYMSGVFDNIILNNPEIKWSTTLETNRGCPFSCTFCDWGSLTYAKVKKFPEEKVYQEIEWLGANKIEYIFMADANFGIFPDRDMAITEYILDVQARTGFPATVNANWHKNAKQNVIEIVKKFISNGFNRGMTLSVQSMDDDVLKIIKRKNMDVSHLSDMMDVLNKEGIGSYTELILPLPGETTETWRDGLTDVLEIGQHTSIEIWFHQLLENAQSNQPEHIEEYGFKTVALPDYIMGDLEPHGEHISEITEVVVETNTMSYEEFLDCWMYAWMIINFHCGGWSQVITRVNRKQGKMAYKTAYERLYAMILDDDGICGTLYKKQRKMLHNYLQTGKVKGTFGHTMFWYANRELHQNYEEVMQFIEKVYNPNSQLMSTQRAFVTDMTQSYPQTFDCEFDFLSYINDGIELKEGNYSWTLDIEKQYNTEEQYLEWLYFRRRQGFGKNKWK